MNPFTEIRSLRVMALDFSLFTKLSRSFLCVCVLLLSADCTLAHFANGAAQSEMRVWTSKKGTTITAKVVDFKGGKVVLKTGKGKIFRVDPNDLVEENREAIQQWQQHHEENREVSGKRKKPSQQELRLCKIALDISYNCFSGTFGGSMKKVDKAVEEMISTLNEVWVPEVGIKFEIGNLEVRQDKKTDPYQATREPGAMMGIGRRVNKKHRCDVVVMLCANAKHGGGLGGGRGVWVAWAGNAWDLLHHELSHAFGTSHGHGWPYEKGTMNQASQGSRYPRERRHTFNYKEVEIIRENTKNLKKLDPMEKVKPYAMFDEIRIKKIKSQQRMADGGIELILDPLENDYDINGDEIELKGVDKKSANGAKVTPLKDGRVRYQMKSKFADYHDYDFFHYEIKDATGLKSKGGVVLIFEGQKEIVRNGDFSNGKKAWKMLNADIVENGEAITSIKIDQRALIKPGGEIVQEVNLDRSLSEKYILQATIYCGPERNDSGNEVKPSEDPELVMSLDGDIYKAKKITTRDATVQMPFQLKVWKGKFKVRFTNNGKVPVRVGHVTIRPVE